MLTMKGYVYIIKSQKSSKFYIGSTIDTARRLIEHNTGKTIATKYAAPWVMVFSKQYATIREARQMEYKLKKQKSRTLLERIVKEQKLDMGL